jgi:ankyrin repeat protein
MPSRYSGDSRLHALVSYGYVSDEALLAALASRKLNPSARNAAGQTALHLAVQCAYFPGIDALLAAGADISIPDGRGRTAMHVAAVLPAFAPESVARLWDGGAEVVTADDDGVTPLHLAAATNNGLCVTALLYYGANRDARTVSGDTALHLAASSGGSDAAHALLGSGAIPSLVGAEGLTPAQLASAAGNGVLARELRAAEAALAPQSRPPPPPPGPSPYAAAAARAAPSVPPSPPYAASPPKSGMRTSPLRAGAPSGRAAGGGIGRGGEDWTMAGSASPLMATSDAYGTPRTGLGSVTGGYSSLTDRDDVLTDGGGSVGRGRAGSARFFSPLPESSPVGSMRGSNGMRTPANGGGSTPGSSSSPLPLKTIRASAPLVAVAGGMVLLPPPTDAALVTGFLANAAAAAHVAATAVESDETASRVAAVFGPSTVMNDRDNASRAARLSAATPLPRPGSRGSGLLAGGGGRGSAEGCASPAPLREAPSPPLHEPAVAPHAPSPAFVPPSLTEALLQRGPQQEEGGPRGSGLASPARPTPRTPLSSGPARTSPGGPISPLGTRRAIVFPSNAEGWAAAVGREPTVGLVAEGGGGAFTAVTPGSTTGSLVTRRTGPSGVLSAGVGPTKQPLRTKAAPPEETDGGGEDDVAAAALAQSSADREIARLMSVMSERDAEIRLLQSALAEVEADVARAQAARAEAQAEGERENARLRAAREIDAKDVTRLRAGRNAAQQELRQSQAEVLSLRSELGEEKARNASALAALRKRHSEAIARLLSAHETEVGALDEEVRGLHETVAQAGRRAAPARAPAPAPATVPAPAPAVAPRLAPTWADSPTAAPAQAVAPAHAPAVADRSLQIWSRFFENAVRSSMAGEAGGEVGTELAPSEGDGGATAAIALIQAVVADNASSVQALLLSGAPAGLSVSLPWPGGLAPSARTNGLGPSYPALFTMDGGGLDLSMRGSGEGVFCSALHAAVAAGRVDLLPSLAESAGEGLDVEDGAGASPASLAAALALLTDDNGAGSSPVRALQWLLQCAASVDAGGGKGLSVRDVARWAQGEAGGAVHDLLAGYL